jgi:hypothetical protein
MQAPASPRSGLRRWLPILTWLPTYERSWLKDDLMAGLGLTALLVPQGMAYAQLAGLPPITGLYTSIMCLVAYAVFGPSRVLVLGPDSSLGPMIAASILPMLASGGDPISGPSCWPRCSRCSSGSSWSPPGAAKLGFIADLLSKPTMVGYMNGFALTILVGQVRKLCGFSIEADGLVGEIVETVRDDRSLAPRTLWALGIGRRRSRHHVVRPEDRCRASASSARRRRRRHRGRALPAEPALATASRSSVTYRRASRPLTLPLVGRSQTSDCWSPAPAGITLVALADTISDRLGIRAAHWTTDRRQSGDGRHRRRQHARGLLPGLRGEHERVAHRGGLPGGRASAR